MTWATSDRVVGLRDRHAAVDVAVETLEGWRLHLSSRNAAVLAFWSFLSIFPAMLAATTILGFVLQDDEQLQQDIVNGALDAIPVLGDRLAQNPASLSGNWFALIIGFGGALWSATRAFTGLQSGLDDVWEIPVDDRAKLPVQRGKALLGILIIGGVQVVTIVLTTLVNQAGLAQFSRVLLTIAAVVINVGVVMLILRLMTAASPSWRDVLPGAVTAGIAYSVLQHFGVTIVDEIADGADQTYGTFALVLGIVTWLWLIAIATLMSAELNAALVRRREGRRAQ